jgi:apolipoprotein D and lipocalin family protein
MRALFTLLPLLLFLGCTPKQPNPPQTVERVDLQRYLGQWYEIARYPHSFEKDCTGVTAEYARKKEGTIAVTNTCYLHSLEGEKSVAEGQAYVVDGSRGAKLRVTFFWPFYGDYWILELAPDYRYALVGSPDRQYLWLLSRSKTLTSRDRTLLLRRAEEAGYDLDRLIWTPQ